MFDAYFADMFLRVVAVCLVLTGIHGYLGIHVLARQVIFVDLAMAQIAALGATCAVVLGYDPVHHPADATAAYLFSLAFTLAGAAIFAATRMRHERIPQEAIIGIVYATASALVVLILSKSATGGEQIKHMLTGNILMVDWFTVAKTAAIYGTVGALHWVFRRPFLQISFEPDAARREGRWVRLWDFLFYASFGVVITSSVAIAGVLLVFSFLVVPAAVGVLLSDSVRGRLLVGWAVGTAVSVCGALASFYADVPAGPMIVTAFAVSLLLAGIGRFLARGPSGREVLLRLALPAAAGVAVIAGVARFAGRGSVHPHAAPHERLAEVLRGGNETQAVEALRHLADHPDPALAGEVAALAVGTGSERVREHAVRVLARLGGPRARAALEELAARPDTDAFLAVEIGRALVGMGSPAGTGLLLRVLDSPAPLLARRQAVAVLREATGRQFGYDPAKPAGENREALRRWKAFVRRQGK